MAVNKNFVVKNGIEIATDVIVASSETKNVGVGTTVGQVLLDVKGAIGATHLSVSGVGTIVTLNATDFTSTNGTIGSVQISSGTITATSGVVTYYGDGSNLSNVGGYWIQNDAGIHTTGSVGVGTTNPNSVVPSDNTSILNVGILTAYKLYGDGSGLTNLPGNPTLQTVLDEGNSSSTGMSVAGLTTFSTLNVQTSLGVGTEPPSSRIHIREPHSHVAATQIALIENSSTGEPASLAFLAIADNGDVGNQGAIYFDAGTDGTTANNKLQFTAQHQDTITPDMTLDGSGNVGIGTINPNSVVPSDNTAILNVGILTAYKLYGDGSNLTGVSAGSTVADDTTTNETFYPVFTQTTSGTITASKVSTTKFTFNPSTGEASATNFNSTSDESLKTNIHTVENSLDIVDQLRGVSFDWKENGKGSYGVIAQELEQVLPELVAQTDPKSVNYNGIIGVLIEAVKELKKEINELRTEPARKANSRRKKN